MKYALLICDDEQVSPSNEEIAADPVHQAWQADLDRRGAKIIGIRLRPIVDSTTVRVRAGETLVSDGPFAETKDFVGGVDKLALTGFGRGATQILAVAREVADGLRIDLGDGDGVLLAGLARHQLLGGDLIA